MELQDKKEKKFADTLKSCTSFDGIEETECQETSSELVSKLNFTLPSSTLTLALIYNICHEKEPDIAVREEFFKAVCDKLCELNYLNSSTIALYKKLVAPGYFKILKLFLQKVHDQVHSSRKTLTIPRFLQGPVQKEMLALQYPTVNQYEDSFDELAVIGEGGSGVVCKAVHKVDGTVYAVKKIFFKFRNDMEFEKIIREAKSFAVLRHRNIVNYNNAWLVRGDETGAEKRYNSDESSEGDSAERYAEQFVSKDSIPSQRLENVKSKVLCPQNNSSFRTHKSLSVTEEEKEDSIHFCSITCDKMDNSDVEEYSGTETVKNKSSKRKSKSFQWSTEDLSECQKVLSTDCCYLKPILTMTATLYIQMEYCERDLDSWLKERNNRNPNITNSGDMMNIFRQILCGVDYIHSKSIIHRDLKPKNIFISEPKETVKIGDFGLACLVQQTEDFSCGHHFLDSCSAVHGTYPYSAPEQRKGKKYDFKVDIYSLGIILFEFHFTGITRQEFDDNLRAFLAGEFHMQASVEVVNLVKKLVKEHPDERPTAGNVLKDPLFKKKSIKKNIADIYQKCMGCVKQMKILEEFVYKLRKEQIECKEMLKSNKEVMEQNKIKDNKIKELTEELNLLKIKNRFLELRSTSNIL